MSILQLLCICRFCIFDVDSDSGDLSEQDDLGTTESSLSQVLAALVDQQLGNKGAVLVRGLKGVLPTNALWLLEIRNNILLVNKISPKN